MSKFKAGDKVVHLGGDYGNARRNRGLVLTVLDGPYNISGWSGSRYIVDRPVYAVGAPTGADYHADEEHLLLLK